MSDAGGDERRQQLSALMDGELGAADAAALCRDWRADARLRATWHTYHLIADVMRSDDLAQASGRDERFLQMLRQHLADEPVVVAPLSVPAATAAARRPRWLAPAAVAAGFVAVAGVLVVTRLATPVVSEGGSMLASAPALPSAAVRVSTAPASPAASGAGTDGVLIRDARLDRYLEAHKQYGPTAAMVPGGVVRSTAAAAPQR